MTLQKTKTLRDRRWLNHVRTLPCLVTGRRGNSDVETVDPAHIGRGGKGIKGPDNEVIPLLHHIHLDCHSRGEYSVLLPLMPCQILTLMWHFVPNRTHRNWTRDAFMLALRTLARQEHQKWQSGSRPFVFGVR